MLQPQVEHLYDIGRNIETKFDPKQSKDSFVPRAAHQRDLRLGVTRCLSASLSAVLPAYLPYCLPAVLSPCGRVHVRRERV